MAGKPTIPKSVIARIRRLDKAGHSRRSICEAVSVSMTTVRKALDPDFAERERLRHRARAAEQYARRKDNPDYAAYQDERNKAPERLAQVREAMRALRAKRSIQPHLNSDEE